MCGFAGVIGDDNSAPFTVSRLKNMLGAIAHRGPDDEGVWSNENVFMGHRRLAIHDLSPAGHQPMSSQSNRYVVVFNGEIYNFKELREKLPKISYKGSSDTEVLLNAIEFWGIEKALKNFNGMFAFALWDKSQKTLTLARDRLGEKPLYFGLLNNNIVFASELTAIEKEFGDVLHIDRSAVALQATYSYIPAPKSIYKEIQKLEPGTFISFDKNGATAKQKYWSLNQVITKANRFKDIGSSINRLHDTLSHAVKIRMAADVPLGAFLSGGIDSSLIVALMQKQSTKPINTFSIGFDVPGYNEAEFAKEVSTHLGTNHTEKYFTEDDVLKLVPKLGSMFDEPFSDSSQMPTYLVSAMAKEKVTVSLSGDGGDELFSGYNRYRATEEIWKKISKIPARSSIGKLIQKTPANILNILFFFLEKKASAYGRKGKIGPKLKTLSNWLEAKSEVEFYINSIKHWKNPEELLLNSNPIIDLESGWESDPEFTDFGEWMMYFDTLTYLPGDILTKVDRTAMQVSLEGRIPFLDHNVVEMAWGMPYAVKQNGEIGKWPLKEILYKYLPKDMMDRPKMGFGVPIDTWIRGELSEWAQDLLSFERLKRQGLFNPYIVNKTLSNHLKGSDNNGVKLWDLLMFQSWLEADSTRARRL